MQANQVDAIIATGDPFILFDYAASLSKEFDIPWIADYRDPWLYGNKLRIPKIFKVWETKIVSDVTYITYVNEIQEKHLINIFPDKRKQLIPNGYDPEIINNISCKQQDTSKLTISFVGTIYDWNPWKSVLSVFSEILEKSEYEMKFHLYGINNQNDVHNFLEMLPEKTRKSVEIFPKMPNSELLKQLATSNVLLLFNHYSIMGTKIFDYMGTRRKIILCYENDEDALELKRKYYTVEEDPRVNQRLQAELLEETNAGIVVQDEAHLFEVLKALCDEFSSTGQIACDSVGVEKYSRKIQVEKLAEIIKSL